jgi:hypothetical protein
MVSLVQRRSAVNFLALIGHIQFLRDIEPLLSGGGGPSSAIYQRFGTWFSFIFGFIPLFLGVCLKNSTFLPQCSLFYVGFVDFPYLYRLSFCIVFLASPYDFKLRLFRPT